MDTASTHNQITVEQLAESFMDRMRRGERPLISEYADQHPELAEEIREVFPALAVLEEFGPAPSKSARQVAEAPALERLGEYRILREVGRGGMGVVYEAIQEPLGRHVALKVLPFQLSSDAVYLERFHREARVAARLHHTNIVPVFDVGEHSGIHYYAMQFIQGLSLDEVMVELRRMRRPAGSVLSRDGNQPHGSFALPSEVRLAAACEGGDGGRFESAALSRSVASSLLSDQFKKAPAPADEFQETPHLAERATEPPSVTLPTGSAKSATDSTSSVHLPGQAALSDPSGSRQHYYSSVARVGLQVADALGYVHAQGLMHRDIKPSNLLLDTRGVVWITDLGLARDDEASALTRSGDVVGTLRYMAPERFRGRSFANSDLYSLGLTLYELLTLRAAFEHSDRGQLMHQITSGEPSRPRKIDPHLPRDLETIVLKAIDKEPRRRYQTADELSADLRSFLEDRPIRARRTGALERSWRWCRRNRALAILAGSVVALLLVLASAGSLAAFLFRGQAAQLSEQAKDLRAERALATQRLYSALCAQAQASRWSGRIGQRFDSLSALTEAARLLPQVGLSVEAAQQERLTLRNEAIACMALTDLRLAQPLHRTPPNTKLLAFDAELKHYIWSDPEGNLSIRRVADHEETVRLPGPGLRGHIAQLSPNERYLAVKYHDPGPAIVKVWDLEQLTTIFESSARTSFDFSPDSQLFVLGQEQDGSIELFDLPSGKPARRFPPGPRADSVRFHPNGRQLAVASHLSSQVRVLDLNTESVVSTFAHPKAVRAVAWEPQGKLLACAGADFRVHVWNLQTGREQAVLAGHQAEVVGVGFNRSGDLLVSSSWDGTTRLWDPWTGQHWITASGDSRQFSFDDRLLAFLGTTSPVGTELGIWDVATGAEYWTLSEPKTPDKGPWSLDISPNGRLMATAGPDGVRLWDLNRASKVSVLAGTAAMSVPPWTKFHPSGDSLLTSGDAGLHRWPIRRMPEDEGIRLDFGPPERLLDVDQVRQACLDQRGQTVAAVHENVAYVSRLDRKSDAVQLRRHPRMARIAISPDGKWIATGTWKGLGVKLWDAGMGQEVADLFAAAESATVAFSPDGKWLVAGANEVYRFWRVGSWAHSHDISGSSPYGAAFTSDGKMMAITPSRQVVQLIDPATGLEWATLESPNPQNITRLCFAPDGSRLAVACSTHVIQLWDLRRIRQQWAAMGLDWESPPYTPTDRDDVEPLHAQVDSGELDPKSATEQLQRRVELLSERVAANPDDPRACNELAWAYVTGPLELRNPEKALSLAEKAVEKQPDNWNYLNTLGVVYYRLGQWEKAIEALDRAGKKSPGGFTASELFFLAMSYHKLGRPEEASASFRRAIEWWEAGQMVLSATWVNELTAFRTEAEELLGLTAGIEPTP